MRGILALFFLVVTATQAGADSIDRGRALLEKNCSRCHAIALEGESPFRPAPPFREVMKIYPAEALTEALGEGLITGHPAMPEFVFPPDEVGAIVDYLKTLDGP